MQLPLERVLTQTGFMQTLLRILTSVPSQPTKAQWQTALPTIFADPCSIVYGVDGPSGAVWMLAYDTTSRSVMFGMSGVQNRNSLAYLATALLNGPHAGPVADPYNGIADTIRLQWLPALTGGWSNLLCFGHSLGGAIAAGFAANMLPTISSTNPGSYHLCTFGAPKFATVRTPRYLPGFSVQRYYLPNDPVPALPPPITSLESFFAGLTTNQVQVLARVLTGEGGAVMLPDRPVPRPQWIPPFEPVTVATLQEWIDQPWLFPSGEHVLEAYARSAGVYEPLNFSRPDSTSGPAQPVQRPPSPSQVATLRSEIAVANSIVTESDPRAAAGRAIVAITPVRGLRFRAGRVNGKRVVRYGSQLVCWTRTRRLQRSMVRFLNRTLIGPRGSLLPR